MWEEGEEEGRRRRMMVEIYEGGDKKSETELLCGDV